LCRGGGGSIPIFTDPKGEKEGNRGRQGELTFLKLSWLRNGPAVKILRMSRGNLSNQGQKLDTDGPGKIGRTKTDTTQSSLKGTTWGRGYLIKLKNNGARDFGWLSKLSIEVSEINRVTGEFVD